MLKARVITALVLVGALLGVLFLAPPVFAAAAFALVAVVAAWEWAGLMHADSVARILYAVLVAAFCWQTYALGDSAYLLFWGASALFWLLACGPWLRRRWSMAGNDFTGYGLGLLLLVSAWAAMVALHRSGPWVLVGVMAIAWVSDIAAYFTGRAIGRRKLAPNISPGKTWEGVAGAFIGVLAYGVAVALGTGWLSGLSVLAFIGAVLALLLLTVLGIIGDLFESLLKRQAGIKDSSQILPGHGGVLDRIDSLLAILPPAALILYWSAR